MSPRASSGLHAPQLPARGLMTLGWCGLLACAVPERTETAAPERATASTGPPPATGSASASAPPPSCIEEGTPYDQATLRERIAFLASPELDGRVPGKPGDERARAFVTERFACLGLLPAGTDGAHAQPFSDAGDATANVIGYIAGTDPVVGDDIIVIGAHHDHLGGGYLGANDNASGVVALLAIAQAVRQRPTPPLRTIAFVAFGAEERGMRGSAHFVAHMPPQLPLARVVQMINLDMVGSSGGFVAAMGTFRGLAATTVIAKLDDHYPKLRVGLGGVARGSDHEPFCKHGIPYVFFWTPDRRCYHERCDTADRVDYPRMADIASLAGELAGSLADSTLDLADLRERRGCGR
ncbi:MAG: Aminopeptidase [Myxococcales bacterium]|nr:Aminopeptidase [Myxococcales bacterium]